jgi:hypothetical protein
MYSNTDTIQNNATLAPKMQTPKRYKELGVWSTSSRPEFRTEVTVRTAAFLDVTQCSLVHVHRRFSGVAGVSTFHSPATPLPIMEIIGSSETPVHFGLTLQRHIPKVSSCLYRSQGLQFFLLYFVVHP